MSSILQTDEVDVYTTMAAMAAPTTPATPNLAKRPLGEAALVELNITRKVY